jgi:hypothetical protein
VVIPYDTTPFVRISIEEVVKTLLEAIVLVFLVMYLFLQNFRATLIPTIAVPVVLLGTFGVLAAFGFSINTLTMFGMVLAIGLLVDDAIVVVENVERVMSEEGLSPREATQVDGPDHRRAGRHRPGAVGGVRADGLLRRLTGVIYRQFSDHHRRRDGLLSVLVADVHPGAVRTMLRVQLRRFGPEYRPGLRQTQGLVGTHVACIERGCGGRSGDGGADAVQGCPRLCLSTAAGAGVRPRQRLCLLSQG